MSSRELRNLPSRRAAAASASSASAGPLDSQTATVASQQAGVVSDDDYEQDSLSHGEIAAILEHDTAQRRGQDPDQTQEGDEKHGSLALQPAEAAATEAQSTGKPLVTNAPSISDYDSLSRE